MIHIQELVIQIIFIGVSIESVPLYKTENNAYMDIIRQTLYGLENDGRDVTLVKDRNVFSKDAEQIGLVQHSLHHQKDRRINPPQHGVLTKTYQIRNDSHVSIVVPNRHIIKQESKQEDVVHLDQMHVKSHVKDLVLALCAILAGMLTICLLVTLTRHMCNATKNRSSPYSGTSRKENSNELSGTNTTDSAHSTSSEHYNGGKSLQKNDAVKHNFLYDKTEHADETGLKTDCSKENRHVSQIDWNSTDISK